LKPPLEYHDTSDNIKQNSESPAYGFLTPRQMYNYINGKTNQQAEAARVDLDRHLAATEEATQGDEDATHLEPEDMSPNLLEDESCASKMNKRDHKAEETKPRVKKSRPVIEEEATTKVEPLKEEEKPMKAEQLNQIAAKEEEVQESPKIDESLVDPYVMHDSLLDLLFKETPGVVLQGCE
jgi:hypothetical protein